MSPISGILPNVSHLTGILPHVPQSQVSCPMSNIYGFLQGWEFAHLISERITHFLSKNERMSDSLKKMSDSLIRSFLVSDLSDLLTIAHFL